MTVASLLDGQAAGENRDVVQVGGRAVLAEQLLDRRGRVAGRSAARVRVQLRPRVRRWASTSLPHPARCRPRVEAAPRAHGARGGRRALPAAGRPRRARHLHAPRPARRVDLMPWLRPPFHGRRAALHQFLPRLGHVARRSARRALDVPGRRGAVRAGARLLHGLSATARARPRRGGVVGSLARRERRRGRRARRSSRGPRSSATVCTSRRSTSRIRVVTPCGSAVLVAAVSGRGAGRGRCSCGRSASRSRSWRSATTRRPTWSAASSPRSRSSLAARLRLRAVGDHAVDDGEQHRERRAGRQGRRRPGSSANTVRSPT